MCEIVMKCHNTDINTAPKAISSSTTLSLLSTNMVNGPKEFLIGTLAMCLLILGPPVLKSESPILFHVLRLLVLVFLALYTLFFTDILFPIVNGVNFKCIFMAKYRFIFLGSLSTISHSLSATNLLLIFT